MYVHAYIPMYITYAYNYPNIYVYIMYISCTERKNIYLREYMYLCKTNVNIIYECTMSQTI